MKLLEALKEPSLAHLRPGTPEFFTRQKQLILERPLLKLTYDSWYARLLEDARSVSGSEPVLELGSGGSYLQDIDRNIITSDVIPDVADKVIDARKLPFENSSLRALLLTHVFHHIPDSCLFFKEAERVLVPGGVISMIEVAHTPFARFFFSNFHHEPYDDRMSSWAFDQKDSMMDSNQALSWIVFTRDRHNFEKQFPKLSIEKLELLPWLAYFASGGVTMKHIIPNWMNGFVLMSEKLISPLRGCFSLYWHIRIRKGS